MSEVVTPSLWLDFQSSLGFPLQFAEPPAQLRRDTFLYQPHALTTVEVTQFVVVPRYLPPSSWFSPILVVSDDDSSRSERGDVLPSVCKIRLQLTFSHDLLRIRFGGRPVFFVDLQDFKDLFSERIVVHFEHRPCDHCRSSRLKMPLPRQFDPEPFSKIPQYFLLLQIELTRFD